MRASLHEARAITARGERDVAELRHDRADAVGRLAHALRRSTAIGARARVVAGLFDEPFDQRLVLDDPVGHRARLRMRLRRRRRATGTPRRDQDGEQRQP
ncbi:MAG: hypothetical protein J0L92_12325 [Deltaproteobacteria bacterium]|nr:hypothetical protein [Deltaproteobacteria bacterium]